jgi:methionine synthase I (cobalamin-dependent)
VESAPPSLASRTRPPGGGPLLFGVDPLAALAAELSPSERQAPGVLARTRPDAVVRLHEAEIEAGADVLLALTADTTSRALHELGMAFRAAAITGAAVDLAADAADRAGRSVAVGAVLGGPWASRLAEDRLAEEVAVHAARLVTAGAGMIVARAARGSSDEARWIIVQAACSTGVPTYALLELDEVSGGGATADDAGAAAVHEWARRSLELGASALLFEVADAASGVWAFEQVRRVAPNARVGLFLRGSDTSPAAWSEGARRLAEGGAWALGGGADTTCEHLAALAADLGRDATRVHRVAESKVG